MLIKSFIVHTDPEKKIHVVNCLNRIDRYEVVPSENTSVLVLVIESFDSDEEKKSIAKIEEMPGVQQLTMVFGSSV